MKWKYFNVSTPNKVAETIIFIMHSFNLFCKFEIFYSEFFWNAYSFCYSKIWRHFLEILFQSIFLRTCFCYFFLLIVECDDPDADFEEICGYGATGCLGNALSPTCQCDTELLRRPSSDGRSCVPSKDLFVLDNSIINFENTGRDE